MSFRSEVSQKGNVRSGNIDRVRNTKFQRRASLSFFPPFISTILNSFLRMPFAMMSFIMIRGKDLAEYLKTARSLAGLSQKEVSTILGYKSSQFVSNWERGLSSPPVQTLKRLCSLYKTSEEDMYRMIRDIAVRQLEEELHREFFASSDEQIPAEVSN